MRIAMCEDEKIHADPLKSMISKWSEQRNIPVTIDHFPSGEAFLGAWSATHSFDLLFLDIQMKTIDGMSLAEMIRKTDQQMIIVFVTSFKDLVFRSFDVGAFKFVVKPIKPTDCYNILDSAYKKVKSWKDNVFLIPVETQTVRLLLNDIQYFENAAHYIEVHSTTGEYRYKERISDLEERLPSAQFFRCHRSYIVNFYHVQVINQDRLQLDDGTVLPVARARWEPLNIAFMAYHMSEHK